MTSSHTEIATPCEKSNSNRKRIRENRENVIVLRRRVIVIKREK